MYVSLGWFGQQAIAARDWRDRRDERDEVGIQSVHVAPFSHVSRVTRHGLWDAGGLGSQVDNVGHAQMDDLRRFRARLSRLRPHAQGSILADSLG